MSTEKSTKAYWESTHAQPRWRLPSRLNVGTRDILRLLTSHMRPGMRVLEIGCAPGKYLAYLAKRRQARVYGLDYSGPGIRVCNELFARLGLQGDFIQENVLTNSLQEGSFDLVYSLGVIEHFDDPKPVIEKHLLLTKPSGIVLITIPNYVGLYGRIQRHFDAEILKIHNLEIMDCRALTGLAPAAMASEVEAFPSGKLSPWLISLRKRWPRPVAAAVSHAFNAVGLLQPFDVATLCPLLVLRMRRQA